ncbi:MAG: DUF4837 family protein [Prevotella sp.]|nr:DUF4837 family protein [Prevotella sp.]
MHGGKRHIMPLLLPLMLITAGSCNRAGKLPASSGKPYEVVIIGDTDSIVAQQLTTPMPGLPQKEPSFDITQARTIQTNDLNLLARSLVIVTIDPRRGKTARLTTEQNAHAQPQTIVSLTAPDTESLRHFMKRQGSRLRNYLTKAELRREQLTLLTWHNAEAENTIRKMFGITMHIPADMRQSKQGKDFLWFSRQDGASSVNICLYRAMPMNFTHQRDSIMRINIPGEHDGMYMQTAALTEVTINPGKSVTTRGTWEMRNDAMGGPFVAYHPTGTDITAEAFVFAPEGRKRNLIRKAEAALYTLKARKRKADKQDLRK